MNCFDLNLVYMINIEEKKQPNINIIFYIDEFNAN